MPLFSKSLKNFGAPSKLVSDAFLLEGVIVDYDFFNWNRAYKISERGDWDGTIGWPDSNKRRKTHYYSELPISTGNWVLFHRKDLKIKEYTTENLKKYIFGVTLGDWAMDGTDEFTQALNSGSFKIRKAAKDKHMFMMLSHRRIDIFPQQIDVGKFQIEQLLKNKRLNEREVQNITYFKKPYRKMPLYLLLSKKVERNKRLIKMFNRGMKKLIDMRKNN